MTGEPAVAAPGDNFGRSGGSRLVQDSYGGARVKAAEMKEETQEKLAERPVDGSTTSGPVGIKWIRGARP